MSMDAGPTHKFISFGFKQLFRTDYKREPMFSSLHFAYSYTFLGHSTTTRDEPKMSRRNCSNLICSVTA